MWSAKKKTIRLFFVLAEDQTDIEDTSEAMQLALQDCTSRELNTSVINESEVCAMKSFKKCQVFVYDRFEGPAFQHVLLAAKQNEAVIVSPICLRTCFVEAISIPENKSPVYTMAMRNVVLSVSNLSPKEKERIKEKVEYMGGIFSHNLRDNTTHLLVGKVGSQKYHKAVETGISVMTEKWVDSVWEASIARNVICTENIFDIYKCPPFYKLEITTSGLDVIDREKVVSLINANGGKYSPQMKKDETNVLIILKPSGQKFTYAQQWGLLCLKTSWIYDSAEKGYMIETQDYIIKNTLLNSTPASSNVKPNFSQNLSEIVAEPKSTIEETVQKFHGIKIQKINNYKSQDNCTTPKKNNGQYQSKNINYKAILNDLNLSDVKKAGTILDGCKIYFSGFSLSEEEKLKRIVISTGGIRYTELNESITHILVGDFSASLAKLLHSIQEKPHVVNINWLIESINLKCTAPEEQFLAMDSSHSFTPESPSPLSKKGLYMMKNATLSQPKTVDKPKPSTAVEMDSRPLDNFIDQYLNVDNTHSNDTQSQKSTCTTQDTISTEDSKLESVLEGLTILLHDLDIHQLSSIKSKIISMGGTAVNTRSYRGKIDYAVVPIVYNEKSLNIKATIVSCLWIEDCYNCVEQVAIEYYHKPVIFSGSMPLKNCVICVTNYAGSERYFLKEVSLLLGAHYQDALSRKSKPEDNIMVTTHLICPAPEGPKYEASVKWGVPVVSKNWLLKCVTSKCRLPENKFPIIDDANKSVLRGSTGTLSIRSRSENHNVSNASFTQKLTVPTENDLESELAVPLKDTEDDIEPPAKKKCSMEIMNSTSQALGASLNKCTPTVERLKLTCTTPCASTSLLNSLKTPDTPYGQIFQDQPVSAETKKNWKKWIESLPSPEISQTNTKNRRMSTPLSELKRRLWDKHAQPPANKLEEANGINISKIYLKNSNTMNNSSFSNKSHDFSIDASKNCHKTLKNSSGVQNNKSNSSSPNVDIKQQSLDKQEFRRTMEELQQDLCMPREPEVTFSRIESQSQDDHTKNSLFKERVVESSQQCSVGWEDPTEQQEKARLKRLTECSKKFILTSMNANDRQKYEDAIEKLGATVLRSSIFCEEVTHVLMAQPSRSEKYLCSLASGKWILHPNYIDACVEKNCYLPEDKYEWGNPLSDLPLSTPLHGAGYRWRSKISSGQPAAFSGMKAVLLTSEIRYHALSRLIQAGGGIVMDKSELLNSTHCIVDQGHGNIPVPLNEIAVKGILLLPAPFLADFLIKDPPPDAKQCLIPEYQAFYNRLAPNVM